VALGAAGAVEAGEDDFILAGLEVDGRSLSALEQAASGRTTDIRTKVGTRMRNSGSAERPRPRRVGVKMT